MNQKNICFISNQLNKYRFCYILFLRHVRFIEVDLTETFLELRSTDVIVSSYSIFEIVAEEVIKASNFTNTYLCE